MSSVSPVWAASAYAPQQETSAKERRPVQFVGQSAPEPEQDRLLSLSLAGSEEVGQGDVLALTIQAWNVGRVPLKGLQVRLGVQAPVFARELVIPLPDLAPDEIITRSVKLTLPAVAGRVQVRAAAEGTLDAPAIATFAVTVRQAQPEVWQPPAGAGIWRPGNGSLEIVLPPGRDAAIAHIGYRSLFGKEEQKGAVALLRQFELTAQDAQGRALTQFQTPILLRWHYAEAMQEAPPIIAPHFVWWNEQAQAWEPVPTRVDEKQGVIQAEVTHFSTYGISEPVEEKVEDPFSGLEANLFTGSLQYRYPIPLFQRPGGFAPGLALSYDSRRRDANQNTGSYDFLVGWGWRLDGLGYINYVDSAPTHKLVLNGTTYTVKKDASWNWYAEEAPWIKITRAGTGQQDDWHVRTPDGTHYVFQKKLDYWNCGKGTQEAKRFLLTSVTAAADDGSYAYSMNIAYGTATRNADTGCGTHAYVYQAWPTTITYNGVSGHSLSATFGYDETTRDDRPPGCTTVACTNVSNAYLYFYTRHLRDITLWVDNRVARRYRLTSHIAQSGTGFQDHRLLLDKIEIYGKDLAGPHPATTFAYQDPGVCNAQENCRLITIDNGQGGLVSITYLQQNGANNLTLYVRSRTLTDQVTGSSIQEQFSFSGWDDGAGGYDFAQVKNLADNERHSHWFYHQSRGDDEGKNGQERMTVHQRGNGSWIDKLWQDYQLPEGLTDPKQRHLLDAQVYSLYDDTGANEQSIWKKLYRYKKDHQDNGQYGNLTHLYEYQYDNGWQLVRTRERIYHPDDFYYSGHYIVNRVAEEKVWAGDVNGTCKSHVRYYYDNQSLSSPPLQGLLTKKEGAENTCGSGFITLVTNGYDSWDNLNSSTDALQHATTYAYDNEFHAFVSTVTNANSQSVQATYNPNDVVERALGLIYQITDRNGQSTSFTYDAFARLNTADRPLGGNPDEQWTYLDYGGATSPRRIEHQVRDDVTTGGDNGYLTSWVYFDGLGRVLQNQQESEEGSGYRIVSSRHYDTHGRPDKEGVPYEAAGTLGSYKVEDWNAALPQYTAYAYDALGRTITVTHTDGTSVQSSYLYQQTTVLDELNHKTVRTVDGLGRLIQIDQYKGTGTKNDQYQLEATAQYVFDALDRLTDVYGPDANGNPTLQTHIVYDALGRKTSMDDPDMGAWSYAYDAAGNLIRQTDARPKTLCYEYDALNRLRYVREDPDTVHDCAWGNLVWRTTYDYDQGTNGIGRRTHMDDQSGNTTWEYDARGRTTKETKVIGWGGGTFMTQWSYDAMDRIATMTYPGGNAGQAGEVVTYEYNAQGLPERLHKADNSYTYVDKTEYNALGQVTERWLKPNGVIQQTYTYSVTENFRLTGLKSGTSPDYDNLQDYSYTYDDDGDVLTITDAAAGNQKQAYIYDDLNRLITATVTAGGNGTYGPVGYDYTANGNIINFEGTSFKYLDTNHPHAITHFHLNGSDVQKYQYDDNGNVIWRNNGGQINSYTYDAENRLASTSGSTTTTFVYDGDGNLTRIHVGSSITYIVGQHYQYANGQGTKHYTINGVRIAERVAGAPYFLLTDHLGSMAVTTDQSGAKVTELRYKPYGADRYNPGGQTTDYRYTGQRWQDDIGLYYYNARWYDQLVGRFIQPDTLVPSPGDPQSLNRYSYVGNNPVRYRDPSGHGYCEDLDCVVKTNVRTGHLAGLGDKWGIAMTGPWESENEWMVYEGMQTISQRVGEHLSKNHVTLSGDDWVRKNIGGTHFVRWPNNKPFAYHDGNDRLFFQIHPAITAYQIYHQTSDAPAGVAFPQLGTLFANPSIHFFDGMWEGTPVHEVGHIIDYHSRSPSSQMRQVVAPNSAPTGYGRTDRLEDFAESWRLWVYSPNQLGNTASGQYRRDFISNLVVDLGVLR